MSSRNKEKRCVRNVASDRDRIRVRNVELWEEYVKEDRAPLLKKILFLEDAQSIETEPLIEQVLSAVRGWA